jgi:hypothetical protein
MLLIKIKIGETSFISENVYYYFVCYVAMMWNSLYTNTVYLEVLFTKDTIKRYSVGIDTSRSWNSFVERR